MTPIRILPPREQGQPIEVRDLPFDNCDTCGAAELEGGFTDEVLTASGQRIVYDSVWERGCYNRVRRCYDRIACWARQEGTTREEVLEEWWKEDQS